MLACFDCQYIHDAPCRYEVELSCASDAWCGVCPYMTGECKDCIHASCCESYLRTSAEAAASEVPIL